MCKVIGIENVISNLFLIQDREEISLTRLIEYKSAIEKKFQKESQFVLVDFTNSSIANTLSRNSDIFELCNNAIKLKDPKKLKRNIDYFNSKLSLTDNNRKIYFQQLRSANLPKKR